MGSFRKSSYTSHEFHKGKHRFEHWYRDNTVYFLTSKTRDGMHAFKTEEAKSIFWNRFDHYCKEFGFIPWVTSLLNNHYHSIGYLKIGENLGPLVQRLHGSVSKLVNDTLETRHLPFWRSKGNKDYFDGCIRDEKQARRAYRYTYKQAVRHGIVKDVREYPHTRVNVELECAISRALELNVFLPNVPYARYLKNRNHGR